MEEAEKIISLTCDFCKRTFAKEISLINHSCEKKRRWFSKDEPHIRTAFLAWNKFYELSSFGNKQGQTSFLNFINSRYYNAFVKFGKHIRDINAIEPAKFIEYVIKGNIPIDKWTHDFVYEQYVRQLIRQETPESALERNIKLMNEWSTQTGEPWYNFFRLVNTNQATAWIMNGRISPWILYNVDSAIDFFERCTPEQVNIIKQHAPIGAWKIKFNKNKDSCEFIKSTLKESGF
jgi:hypothetical protein